MKKRSLYKGVFLIRLENGYSRPVSIYAKTDVKQLIKPQKKGVFTLYIEAEKPTGGEAYQVHSDQNASSGKYIQVKGKRKLPAEYSFNIPKNGKYFILMRIKSEVPVGSHDSLNFAVDGGEMKAAHLRSGTSWTWAMAANNNRTFLRMKIYEMKKGKHTIKIMPREAICLDMIAITDNPKIFEKR